MRSAVSQLAIGPMSLGKTAIHCFEKQTNAANELCGWNVVVFNDTISMSFPVPSED